MFCIPILDFFPDKVQTVSDEYGEKFRQNISQIEKRYKGKRESKYVGWMLLESYKRDSQLANVGGKIRKGSV